MSHWVLESTQPWMLRILMNWKECGKSIVTTEFLCAERHVTLLHVTLLSDKCIGQIIRTRQYTMKHSQHWWERIGSAPAGFQNWGHNVITEGHEMHRNVLIFVTRTRTLKWQGRTVSGHKPSETTIVLRAVTEAVSSYNHFQKLIYNEPIPEALRRGSSSFQSPWGNRCPMHIKCNLLLFHHGTYTEHPN